MDGRLLLALAFAAVPRANALQITFTDVGPEQYGVSAMSSEALAGFEAAAALWEGLLADSVTLNINIASYDFGTGSSTIIGQAGSNFYNGTYDELRTAWIADATSSTDYALLATLPAGSSYVRRINLTTDLAPPTTPMLAASADMWINGGNAKALGLLPANLDVWDAQIEFNTAFAFDYDRSNGITAGQMDFVGVAAHEIGHALGFVSIVDYIDGGGFDTATAASMPMDFFRYSLASLQLGVTDVSIDDQIRFLLLGNLGILMSTGVQNGDGGQASHFIDNVGLGMMDPTASYGELRTFTGYDLVVMDALGWQLTPQGLSLAGGVMSMIPEPSAYGMVLGGLGLLGAAVRRRRR